VRQTDGKMVASISYVGPESSFLAFRFTPDGLLDASFGNAGIASVDMAPGGVFSDPSALALDGEGRVIVAGMAERITLAPNEERSIDLRVIKPD